jgi:transcriptional regulator with GAF, ATPase, and Fis domain
MEKFRRIMLDVWREACRHIHITESTVAIAELLMRRMPLEQILVRRIDVTRCALETVAVARADADHASDESRSEVPHAQLQEILAWCSGREIYRGAAPGDGGPLAVLRPHAVAGEVMAIGLVDQQGPAGVLLLVARPPQSFDATHATILDALREPFSVALENDGRVREMAALREAAEADRQSLLTKLGRSALGDTIVGAETGLQPVMERVKLVGRSDVPVLIFGQTGTGKELIARAIHERSPRAGGPFIRVNCGAVPAELIDSQLFGHEKGSFTGATETHRGWFERADRGTLFLDEIGELPPAAQVRLLRVLQDGSFERVGGQQPITVDVRIVAATHRDLSGMVREAKFREDLWYRLAIFPINLPLLRERPDDIPAMARHFAQRAATRFGLPPLMPTAEDLRLLVAYAWPGNVRELGAVMDRAAILGDGRKLEVATALGAQTPRGASPPEPALAANEAPAALAAPRAPEQVLSLDAAMKRHIESALTATQGRIEGPHGAAAILEINPHTLRARMRKLGIDWNRFRAREEG